MNLSFHGFLAAAMVSTADAFNFKMPFGLEKNTESDANLGMPNPNWSAVYAMTNQEKNEILVYSRDPGDGSLEYEYSVDTAGSGLGQVGTAPGDPLAAQDPMVVARQCLLAVNAGSNTVSTFHIEGPRVIRRVGFYDSGGAAPVSIAEKDGLVYVLNSWGQGSIQGFRLDQTACIIDHIGAPIMLDQEYPEMDGPPNGLGTPTEVGFTPEGNLLVVNKIDGGFQNFPTPGIASLNHYMISEDGSTSAEALTKTPVAGRPGSLPFAFDFDTSGNLIIAEVFFGGAPDDGTNGSGGVSTWTLNDDYTYSQAGDVTDIGEIFTCWVRFSKLNNCAYSSNAGAEGSISSLSLVDGTYKLEESVAAGLNAPIDLLTSKDGHNLYVLSNAVGESSFRQGSPAIHVYSLTEDSCALTKVQEQPMGFREEFIATNGAVGLAVFPGNP